MINLSEAGQPLHRNIMRIHDTAVMTRSICNAVLVVKIPKTEEYKALQPKKVDVQ